jgi:hypothetical protein
MSGPRYKHRDAETSIPDTALFEFFNPPRDFPVFAPMTLLTQPNAAGGGYQPVLLPGTAQALSGAGAIAVTQHKTNWTTTGVDAGTLADGTIIGQVKVIQLIVDGGDGTLTPANFADGATITFADAGDTAELIWDGSDWNVLDLYNRADGATAPVVA